MRISLEIATVEDVPDIVALRASVAQKLTDDYGELQWSGISTEKGVLFHMRNSKLFVVRKRGELIATLRLATKKPWAIDARYFKACKIRPIYLLSMAISPDWQRKGIGRLCMKKVREICQQWPADSIRLDAYDAPAGAGEFYAKCGFENVGRASYRGCPLAYYEMMLS